MLRTANFAPLDVRGRIELLSRAIESIYDQVNLIRVCLNGYEQVPESLRDPKILSEIPNGHRGAVGKFRWAMGQAEHYFTMDDDIIYPRDYVEMMLEAGKRYPNALLTAYGSILLPGVHNYEVDRLVLPLDGYQGQELRVSVGGTGAMLCNPAFFTFDEGRVFHRDLPDLSISHQAHLQGLPIMAVRRPGSWIRREPVDCTVTTNAQLVGVQNEAVRSNAFYQTHSPVALLKACFASARGLHGHWSLGVMTKATKKFVGIYGFPRGPGQQLSRIRDWMSVAKPVNLQARILLTYVSMVRRLGLSRLPFLRQLLAVLAKNREFLEFRIHDFRLTVSPSDPRSMKVPDDFCLGIRANSVFARVLNSGYAFVDVGANQGGVSAAAAYILGGSGVILSFEPNPALADVLRKNLSHTSSAEIHEVAVSSYCGDVVLYVPAHSSGEASTVRNSLNSRQVNVRALTLDSLAIDQRYNLPGWCFKVDIEGAELAFLEGAQNTLRRLESPPLILELNSVEDDGRSQQAITELLLSLGYKWVFPLTKHFLLTDTHFALDGFHSRTYETVLFTNDEARRKLCGQSSPEARP